MKKIESYAGLLLHGLDGSNPLAFFAALGATVAAHRIFPETRLSWSFVDGAWRPVLTGCEQQKDVFLEQLHSALHKAPMWMFEIDSKLPFPVEKYVEALKMSAGQAGIESRRDCDLLAAFGTEMYPEPDTKKVLNFQDTRLRMVRSGDSAGQGFPVYARAIREATGVAHLRRTLFEPWDYLDSSFSSLRWDPIEDQRYALRWRDPSKAGRDDGPGGMLGANSLAIEALCCLPTMPVGRSAETTGFQRRHRQGTFFTWPIWNAAVSLDTVRSLLSLAALGHPDIPRRELEKMGIVEVFRSQRVQQNQYYSNFAPAQPA